MIDVFTNNFHSGRLSPLDGMGSTFVYNASEKDVEVSITMPIQPQSWDQVYGVLPIFEMNLPEGALRAALQSRFAKALGHFSDLDLLAITGRHQIGRLAYQSPGFDVSSLTPPAPNFQSVDEILSARRDGDLFGYLMRTYSAQSGISGVQPKVLIRDPEKLSAVQKFSEQYEQSRPKRGQSVRLAASFYSYSQIMGAERVS